MLRDVENTEKDLDNYGGRAKLEEIAGFTTEEARGNLGDSAEQVHRDERQLPQPPSRAGSNAPGDVTEELEAIKRGTIPPPAPPPPPTPMPQPTGKIDPNAGEHGNQPLVKPRPGATFTQTIETDDKWTTERIKKFENLMLQAYNDNGNWAIGYGYNFRYKGKNYTLGEFPTKEKLAEEFATDGSGFTTVITRERAEELFVNHYSNNKKEAERLSYWKYANVYGQSALIEIISTLGFAGFKGFTKAQKLLEQGKFWLGAIEMWDSTWAKKGPGGIGPGRAAAILNLLAVGSTIDSAFRTEPLPWMRGNGRDESNRVASSAGSGAEINAGSNAIADATAKQNLVPDTQVIRIAKNQINYKSVDSANRFETATYVGA